MSGNAASGLPNPSPRHESIYCLGGGGTIFPGSSPAKVFTHPPDNKLYMTAIWGAKYL